MNGPRAHAPTARTVRLQFATGALLALAVAGGLAGGLSSPSWFVPALVPLVLAWHLLAASRRPSDAGLLGPLFFYDVVRLARRGRSTLLRCVYALALLVALCFAYAEQFPHAPLFDLSSVRGPDVALRDMPRFAQTVSVALLLAQGVAVLALTPAYVAGAVAEEKERRTLELLFTSHLSDREIVLGKLLARLAHLGGVFLTGLPVLCLTLLWGGVSAPLLAGGFAAAGATLFSVGGVSVLCSVLNRTPLAALVRSYVLVAAFSLFGLFGPLPLASSPVAFVVALHDQLANGAPRALTATTGALSVVTLTPLAMTNVYVGLHLLIGWACTAVAVRHLRAAGPRQRQPARSRPRLAPAPGAAGAAPEGPDPHLGPADEPLPPDQPAGVARPPIGDRPLLWKELYGGGLPPPLLEPRDLLGPGTWLIALTLLMGALAVNGTSPDGGRAFRGALNLWCRPVAILLAGWWCLATAFTAAGSVSRERDRGTLSGLLTLPVGRGALLGAKWLGSILRWRPLGWALLGVWSGGLLTGALHPLAVLLSALACATCLALLASVGLWLSLVSRNTLWARVSMAAVLLLVFLVPWVVWMGNKYQIPTVGWQTDFRAWGLNPLAAWWFVGFSWSDVPGPAWEPVLFQPRLLAVLAGLALQAAAAAGAWLLAWRRLRSTFGR
jgi:ABC-type transport system involved in multi-copper enzyme maturation permease subunit